MALDITHAGAEKWLRQRPRVPQTHAVAAQAKACEWLLLDASQGWDKLCHHKMNVSPMSSAAFLTLPWIKVALQAVAPSDVVFAVLAGDGRVKAFLPLKLQDRHGIRIAYPLGDPLWQYSDLAGQTSFSHDPRALEELRRALRAKKVDCLVLPKVRSDSSLAKLLQGDPVSLARQTEAAVIDLKHYASFDDYMTRFSASTRKSWRQKYRRLEGLGAVSFEVHKGADALPLVREAIRLKQVWLKQRGLRSRVLRAPLWIEALLRALGDLGDDLIVSSLSLNGKAIALEIGFQHGKSYVSYLGAYHPGYADYSVGALQIKGTIEWCFVQGFNFIDLLAPNDAYKQIWTHRALSVPVSDYLIPTTLKGRVYTALRTKAFEVGLALYKISPIFLKRLVLSKF